VYNNQEFSVLPELVSPDYHLQTSREEFKGYEGFKQHVVVRYNVYPDLHITVNNMVGEGDTVATVISFTGTHKGNFGNIEPTGKRIKQTQAVFIRLEDGKVIEETPYSNVLSLYQQLEALPPTEEIGK